MRFQICEKISCLLATRKEDKNFQLVVRMNVIYTLNQSTTQMLGSYTRRDRWTTDNCASVVPCTLCSGR